MVVVLIRAIVVEVLRKGEILSALYKKQDWGRPKVHFPTH